MAGDRAFENQFQWEVDRWVFRDRHRGDPIEVTAEERDRIVALHRQRMATGTRVVCGIPLLAPLVLGWRYVLLVPAFMAITGVFGLPALMYWGHVGTVKQIQGKPLLGTQLGPSGRIARQATVQSWGNLLGSLAMLIPIGAFALWVSQDPRYADQPLMNLAMFAMVGSAFIFIGWMTSMKWAQRERERVHDQQMDAIQRARDLGGRK
jgi:uncharacterized membrane protein